MMESFRAIATITMATDVMAMVELVLILDNGNLSRAHRNYRQACRSASTMVARRHGRA
ncbi:hypothetical protein [Slackia heliotrinireducens]|uniref:hypothetical protein n=1 Tax=Slackia heliotrinireducens TaxID=84110 RepID=UPI001E2EA543|nr:hypothetical protein [Slackia heliotrinireducens]